MARDKSGEETIEFDEGVTWLSSQLLHEPCDTTKANSKSFQQNRHHYRHHHRRLRFQPQELPLFQSNSKSGSRPAHRPKFGQNWASGGPGMQAIFLESAGQKSCGTGVFLPQRAGTNTHTNNKKSACAPVLLPSRVVQALNLNVHALGLQISPRQDSKITRTGEDRSISSPVKNKRLGDRDVPSSQCSVISQKRSSSPELFLPKEWTY